MGAYDFKTIGRGKTANDAFVSAVREACHEHGHGGYTGTIAEKHDFRMISATLDDAIRLVRGSQPFYQETADELATRIDVRVKGLEALRACPLSEQARAIADALIEAGDPRIHDKWGPAGCIELGGKGDAKEFLFFGWASS